MVVLQGMSGGVVGNGGGKILYPGLGRDALHPFPSLRRREGGEHVFQSQRCANVSEHQIGGSLWDAGIAEVLSRSRLRGRYALSYLREVVCWS